MYPGDNKIFDNSPLVSVIAICYNQEEYVLETLNSIKAQTYPNIELIISDDGSTDGTKAIVKKWIDENYPSARFICHPSNMGITKNLNGTIPYINGSFVKVIGCDDVLLDDSISVIMKEFMKLPEDYGVIYSDMFLINDKGETGCIGMVEKRGHPVPSGFVYEQMIKKPFATAASIIYRKEVLDKLKCYNGKVDYEDNDFYLRASRFFKFHYMPEKLVKYRVHAQSLINLSSKTRYYKNEFLVYLLNFDKRTPYRQVFMKRLLFCFKNLYAEKFQQTFIFSLRAFLKTGNPEFIKYGIAGIPFLVKDRK